MQRIVSLLPSATEIVCALGFGDQLVGRSHECDFPASAASLPVLTHAKLDPSASSRAIDDAVKRIVSLGTSVYEVDADALQQLAPNVILTQDQCEVCAVSVDDLEQALGEWIGSAPQLVSLSPRTLGDVWVTFSLVADALGDPDRGLALATELANGITAVAERAQRPEPRPRVACVEWLDPLMAAGNWMPELVMLAGGENLLGDPGAHSPWLEAGALAEADPDVVVVMPCGFDLERTRSELERVIADPEWRDLRAVRERRVAVVDGNQYFNRPGPRLVDSLEILAEIVQPDAFAPSHAGTGWELL